MVPEAQSDEEESKKRSHLASLSRRKKSIASPIILSENDSNTNAVAWNKTVFLHRTAWRYPICYKWEYVNLLKE